MTRGCKRLLVFCSAIAVTTVPVFAQGVASPDSTVSGAASSPSSPSTSDASPGPAAGTPPSFGGKYQNPALAPLPPSSVISDGISSSGYVLGPGDELNISVQPQTKYGLTDASIEQDGTLEYPRIGTINAAGKTVSQLRDEITSDLAKYCVNPDVTVEVAALRPQVIYITGGVKTPQILDLRAAPNVAKAVTLSGGALDNDELAHITVFRGNVAISANVYGILVNGVDNGQNIDLRSGDLIVVPLNTQKFAVVGAVMTPGIYPLTLSGGNEGQTHLADALAAAGGTERTGASIHDVQIVQALPDGTTKSVSYDYGKYVKLGDASDNPVVTDKDLIYVPDSRHTVTTPEAFSALSVLAILKDL
jgi:protein involved in polysaccharide export with SLBB domain